MNMIWIAGHLGADPEVRFTASGQKITSLRVATNHRRQGKDETVWWRCTIFGDRHDKMLTYLKKGSAVIVMGRMNPPQLWTDKEGRQQVSLEMVVETIDFSPFGKSERSGQEGSSPSYSAPASYAEPKAAAAQPQGYHAASYETTAPRYNAAPPAYGANPTPGYQPEAPFNAPSYQHDEREDLPF
jgi:single-strand DNA-binding protein